MKKQLNQLKISKEISHSSLTDNANDREYWLSKSHEERFEAIEILRQIFYNYDPTTERLQRIIETFKLTKG